MKKQLLTALLLLMACSFLLTGCGDDDETVVSAAAAQGYILGEASLYPEVYFYADIMPVNNTSQISLDSVVAFDSICEIRSDSYWWVYGDNNYMWTEYSNDADSFRYASGDDVEISFYKNGSRQNTTVTLLNYYDDYVTTILPVQNDTVSLGSAVNFIWNSVPGADWYGAYIYHYSDSAGTYISHNMDTAFFDTAFTLPAAQNIYDGYYDVYLIAVSGPGPNDSPNLSGNGIMGYIVSRTSSNSNHRVYLGTGDPNPVSGNQTDEPLTSKEVDKQFKNLFDNNIPLPTKQTFGNNQ